MADLDIETARAIPVIEIAARYGLQLRRDGRDMVGGCPVCGGHNRFAVHLTKPVWHCRGCDRGGDGIALVRHAEGLDFRNAVLSILDGAGAGPLVPVVPTARDDAADLEAAQRAAERRLGKARPDLSGPVYTWLRYRGLRDFDDLVGGVLRYDPAMPWLADDGETLVRHPGMVAALRHVETGALQAVHKTALTPDGRKIGRRTIGAVRGTAVRLDRAGDDPAVLTACEGIETGLAGRMLGLSRVWCFGSRVGIAKLRVLPGVEHLFLCEEVDENGASARAVAECGSRWQAEGRKVTVIRPTAGSDLNDQIRSAAR